MKAYHLFDRQKGLFRQLLPLPNDPAELPEPYHPPRVENCHGAALDERGQLSAGEPTPHVRAVHDISLGAADGRHVRIGPSRWCLPVHAQAHCEAVGEVRTQQLANSDSPTGTPQRDAHLAVRSSFRPLC
eukprot:4800292-Prymnesium_polylepis.1